MVVTRASARFVIWAVLLCGSLQVTSAQGPGVTDPPPAIDFDQPREVGRTEASVLYEMRFPSAVATGSAANDVVPVRVVVPADLRSAVPYVVLLHYYGATSLRLEESLAHQLSVRGIGSLIVTLPHHMRRAPAGAASGGQIFMADVGHFRRVMLQSVADVRRALDWAETRPEFRGAPSGIMGTSLGAIIASLAFAVEPRLDSAAFLLGGADLASILWNSSLLPTQRESLRRQGYDEDRLRLELADVEPLTYLVGDAETRSSLMVRARFDSVIPTGSTDRLAKALGQPHTIWLDTGHYGAALVEATMVRTVAGFFSSAFRGQSYRAPRLYSPTVRLGLLLNQDAGLQVAAGIDLWRSNRGGDGFAAAFLTARGPQGFIGYKLGRGLSLGVSISGKRTGPGVLWTLIL